MACWTFLDFVDDRGENQIRAWIEGQPPSFGKRLRATLNARLDLLSAMKPLRGLPYTKILDGECDGLFEIRFKANNVQCRPLCFYGPNRTEITILMGAKEMNGRFVPPNACTTAQSRKALVESERRYVREHERR